MFYSKFMFVKKGPLSKVWIAAHYKSKLTRANILATDIDLSAKSIQESDIKLALRVRGQLLLGLVRIYQQKVKYLQADCNDAITKIKAYKPNTAIDLPGDVGGSSATAASITLHTDKDAFAFPDVTLDDLEIGDGKNLTLRSSEIDLQVYDDFDLTPPPQSPKQSKTPRPLVGIGLDDDSMELRRGKKDSDVKEADLDFDLDASAEKRIPKLTKGVDLMDNNVSDAPDDSVSLQVDNDLGDLAPIGDEPLPDPNLDATQNEASGGDAETKASSPDEKKADADQTGEEKKAAKSDSEEEEEEEKEKKKDKKEKRKKAVKRKLEVPDERPELKSAVIQAALADTSDLVISRASIPITKRVKAAQQREADGLESLLQEPALAQMGFELSPELAEVFQRLAVPSRRKLPKGRASKKNQDEDEESEEEEVDEEKKAAAAADADKALEPVRAGSTEEDEDKDDGKTASNKKQKTAADADADAAVAADEKGGDQDLGDLPPLPDDDLVPPHAPAAANDVSQDYDDSRLDQSVAPRSPIAEAKGAEFTTPIRPAKDVDWAKQMTASNKYWGKDGSRVDKEKDPGEARMKKMWTVLNREMKDKDDITFQGLVDGKTRSVAAGVFYQLLFLKTRLDMVDLQQEKPYGTITITKTAKFARGVQ